MRLGLALLLASTMALAQVVEAAFRQDPGPLDFIRGQGEAQAVLQALTGDALVGLDASGAVVPRLSLRWEARKDGLRLSLRHDVTFSDGAHLTVQDALWTLQELQRHPDADPVKKQMLAGASIFIQAHQLVLRGPRPAQALLRDLARLPIARRGRPDQGSGPFRLELAEGAWLLHRRAHFLSPRLDGFRFRRFADEGAALRDGRLHLASPEVERQPPPSHRLLPLPGSAAQLWVDRRLDLEPGPTGLFSGTPGPAAWRWRTAKPR